MRLAVSNIGWTAADDRDILPRLLDAGADAVEVAPGRVFDDPGGADVRDATAVAETFRAAGLPVMSMQALLFGMPDLKLFGGTAGKSSFIDYLSHIFELAGALGCGPLVFGSPKNRLKGERGFETACREAAAVFRTLGRKAADKGLVFCLEANATAYGCDFMTVLREAAQVADMTDHPAVGIVADTGNMMMEAESPAALDAVLAQVRHLHVSAPQLGPVAPHMEYVSQVVGRLRDAGYAGDVTLEMRPPGEAGSLTEILRTTGLLRSLIDRT